MDSKAKIIEEAKKLFHKKGVSNTSVEDIATSASVSKSNLYYHFKSKEELVLETLKSRMFEFEEKVVDVTLGNPLISPRGRMERFYETIIRYHGSLKCEGGCPFGNIALELSDLNPKVRYLLKDFFDRWRRKIEDCFKEGVNIGEFRDDLDPYNVSDMVLSHIEGAIMMVKVRKSIESLRRGSFTMLRLLSKKN